MKKGLIFLLVLVILSVTSLVNAGESARLNNKFGIHLVQPHDEDLDKAANLVNAQGGDWGYVTLVIQEDDRKLDKWQGIFDKLRARKLIPIIRIATSPEGSNWKKPDIEDATSWANFLDSLHWVIKNRYVVLFNEPNHASEWGGSVDPEHYAKVAKEFAIKLKEENGDFVVMIAGMDASAPSQKPKYMDEADFLQIVIEEIGASDFSDLFDGLSSHSYPNPNFAGSPNGQGRGTVNNYKWELSFLGSLGVKSLPVFITETGWNGDVLSRTQIAQNFVKAYENVWLADDRVVAVTPFVLNYQSEPFLKFSWTKKGNEGVYPEYISVQQMQKIKGDPDIIQKGEIGVLDFPNEIVESSKYHLRFDVSNKGQAIWSKQNGYHFAFENIDPKQYIVLSYGEIKPFETRTIDAFFKTKEELGKFSTRLILHHNDKSILSSNHWNFEVVSLPSLLLKISLFPKHKTNGSDFALQIFNKNEELIFEKEGIKVSNGWGSIEKVENIVLNQKYRIVLLKKHYLPRQTHFAFGKKINRVEFESMIPLDFNGDGNLTVEDVSAFSKNLKSILLFLP